MPACSCRGPSESKMGSPIDTGGPRWGARGEGTVWREIPKRRGCYGLFNPGAGGRRQRGWYRAGALAARGETSADAVELQSLYRCLDKLLAHKQALFGYLAE